MTSPPTALSPALPSELLSYILAHQTRPSTLIICQLRSTFLTSLLQDINQASPPSTATPTTSPSSPPPPQKHPLLIPTLHQTATARHLNTVFIPTVSHLRAYLSTFPPTTEDPSPPDQKWNKPGTGRERPPLLVVYGLVALHRDTSEWSAQGMGASVAMVVEAGLRARKGVVVLEERVMEDEEAIHLEQCVVDLQDEEQAHWEQGPGGEEVERPKRYTGWGERMPMLNGSVRRAGEDGGWSGRTVEVGRVLSRWFRFQKGEWDA